MGKCGRVRVGTPDPSLAVTELLDRLDLIGLLDAAIGPIKKRGRGFGARELLVGVASAQLAGPDFLVGLDRLRAFAAGQVLPPVPGLASTTASGNQRHRADRTGRHRGMRRHQTFVDALVLATGFDVREANLPAIEVIGREGRNLGKWWR